MVIIDENNEILNNDDKKFLQEKCENFILSQSPRLTGEYINYFNRSFINIDNPLAQNIIKNCESYIKSKLNDRYLKLSGLWINKVDEHSNNDDDFHHDTCSGTLIIYLNENFTGGDFEYKDDNKNYVKIKPKKYLTIVMNDKLYHRVLPVLDGVRYSLVCFFHNEDKKQKSLI
jgi:hypothetical protein